MLQSSQVYTTLIPFSLALSSPNNISLPLTYFLYLKDMYKLKDYYGWFTHLLKAYCSLRMKITSCCFNWRINQGLVLVELMPSYLVSALWQKPIFPWHLYWEKPPFVISLFPPLKWNPAELTHSSHPEVFDCHQPQSLLSSIGRGRKKRILWHATRCKPFPCTKQEREREREREMD